MAEFNIDKFVDLSKKVDLSDIDWDVVARVGITDDEYRILRYMSDTEIHTIIYLRDLLAGYTAADPECTQFMACWVYEETHHGRALDRFMEAAGRQPKSTSTRYNEVMTRFSWREEMTGALSRMGATVWKDFAAAHMCWGAINELTAAASYMAVARKTKNPELAKMVKKLASDERKHYSFYFQQSEKRLKAGGKWAERLCRNTIRMFWEPVGIGVGEPHALDLIASSLFGGEKGHAELVKVDQTIQALPGMGWFNMVGNWHSGAEAWFRTNCPHDWARHREYDRELTAKGAQGTAAA